MCTIMIRERIGIVSKIYLVLLFVFQMSTVIWIYIYITNTYVIAVGHYFIYIHERWCLFASIDAELKTTAIKFYFGLVTSLSIGIVTQ